MFRATILIAIIICAAYAWLYWADVRLPQDQGENKALEITQPAILTTAHQPTQETNNQTSQPSWFDQQRQALINAITTNNPTRAIEIFNQAFETANGDEAEQLRSLFLVEAGKLSGQTQVSLLNEYIEFYDDLDAWTLLANTHESREDWQSMLDSLLRANQLENNTDRYNNNLRRMVRAASKLATDLQRNNDVLGRLALYQSLYEAYPQYARFEYELAQAYLDAGDQLSAKTAFNNLIYDPELGTLAQQRLALIEAQENELAAAEAAPEEPKKNQIVVPLVRAGTSLLVDAQVEGYATRLLLDTGASITSLSKQKVRQLGLRATGQALNLNTANGVTKAKLYYADSLSFGRLNFKNVTVAEVDLGNSRRFDGLLGTDVLRSVGNNYSYLIDDQKNALIFEAR